MSLRDSTVAIVGAGLLGGSLGLALDGACARRIGVVERGDERTARDALLLGAVDVVKDLEEACQSADIVVLATPVGTITELVPRVAGLVRPGALVTDVGSTKRAVVAAMGAATGPEFVGGHPMAGGTSHGIANAHGSLFDGATWVLCRVGDAPVDPRAHELVSTVGAHALELSADEHDRAAALVSHVPYVLARSLVRRLGERPDAEPLASEGWKRLTRSAMGDEAMWRDVLTSNGDCIADELDALRDALADVAGWLRRHG